VLRILVVHNAYQQYGGEDAVFEAEVQLLRANGHEVEVFTRHNDDIESMSKLAAGVQTIWSRPTSGAMQDVIDRFKPDIAHFHNFFPLVSPAAHHVCHRNNLPVIQTLHNYRLLCLNGLFYRDNHVCEDCLGKAIALPGVRHACYRDSRAASATVAGMLSTHRVLRTWNRTVTRYIALTEFAKQKFIQGGLPSGKILVKPHFVDPDPGIALHKDDFFLFVGRLSNEKGIQTLIDAWHAMDGDAPLRIVGDGPLASIVQDACMRDDRIEWLGWQDPEQVLEVMGRATGLIVPSVWYETFGRIVMEAYSRGTPVICSNIGAVAELVQDGVTGVLVEPGNQDQLGAAVLRLASDTAITRAMGTNARREFEQRYSASSNYAQMMDIYNEAIASFSR
jgi:glycosyltransferase involved in cell wall biosynthesis